MLLCCRKLNRNQANQESTASDHEYYNMAHTAPGVSDNKTDRPEYVNIEDTHAYQNTGSSSITYEGLQGTKQDSSQTNVYQAITWQYHVWLPDYNILCS